MLQLYQEFPELLIEAYQDMAQPASLAEARTILTDQLRKQCTPPSKDLGEGALTQGLLFNCRLLACTIDALEKTHRSFQDNGAHLETMDDLDDDLVQVHLSWHPDMCARKQFYAHLTELKQSLCRNARLDSPVLPCMCASLLEKMLRNARQGVAFMHCFTHFANALPMLYHLSPMPRCPSPAESQPVTSFVCS